MKLLLSVIRYCKLLNQVPVGEHLRTASVYSRSFHTSPFISSAFEPQQIEQQVSAKYNLSPAKLKRYRVGFEKFDLNKDGIITKAEFKMAAHDLGLKDFAVTQMEVWFQYVDLDGNGEIDFNEYIHLMENDTCGWLGMIFPNEQAMVDFCFATFDKFQDGYLTKKQASALLAYIRGTTTDEEVNQFMADVNKSKDGRITKIELLNHFLKKPKA